MTAQGWYLDPFGHHEARWFSDGIATALVQDHGVESKDEPQNQAIEESELVLFHGTPPMDGSDIRRADDTTAEAFDAKAQSRAAFDAMNKSATGLTG
jgi:hypothetical protein